MNLSEEAAMLAVNMFVLAQRLSFEQLSDSDRQHLQRELGELLQRFGGLVSRPTYCTVTLGFISNALVIEPAQEMVLP